MDDSTHIVTPENSCVPRAAHSAAVTGPSTVAGSTRDLAQILDAFVDFSRRGPIFLALGWRVLPMSPVALLLSSMLCTNLVVVFHEAEILDVVWIDLGKFIHDLLDGSVEDDLGPSRVSFDFPLGYKHGVALEEIGVNHRFKCRFNRRSFDLRREEKKR